MHISEGVLSAPVLAVGAVAAITGVYIGLRHLEEKNITLCALLSAVFFVGSLIHIPIGVTNAHLVLSGLLGLLLGWCAFPAIFVALLLQAILFQYGGVTTLGVNTFTMGSSAVLSWQVYHLSASLFHSRKAILAGSFLAGFLGIAFAAVLTACALAFTNEGFKAAAYALLISQFPIMLVEGVITSLTVAFLLRLKPGLLDAFHSSHSAS